MKRTNIILITLMIFSVFLLACTPQTIEQEDPLYNEDLNNELEDLQNNTEVDVNTEFSYEPRAEAEYEIADVDLFALTNGSFDPKNISFLGVMLGDSYQSVKDRLGVPDVEYEPSDKSYQNLDYHAKIGLERGEGISFHIVDDKVERIVVKKNFNKFLQGDTELGQSKEYVYTVFDTPDYTDLVSNFKIFFYVEKGLEFYLVRNSVDRVAFTYPEEFKGVTYEVVQEQIGDGIYKNVTRPVRIE
jgi:hypothetical protein